MSDSLDPPAVHARTCRGPWISIALWVAGVMHAEASAARPAAAGLAVG